MHHRVWPRFLALFVLISVAGCGDKNGTPVAITGKVTLAGQPLADANITFHATDKLPAEIRSRMGKTNAEGVYTLADVYPGEYTVMVQKFKATAADPGMAPATVAMDDPLKKYGAESPLRKSIGDDKPKEINLELE